MLINDLRILATGARSWDDHTAIDTKLSEQRARTETLTVVHGDCTRGADRMTREWCAQHPDVIEERRPADWDLHGRAAGPIRNEEMIRLGADLVLAFLTPDAPGTRDCIARAVRSGIPVQITRDSAEQSSPVEFGGLW